MALFDLQGSKIPQYHMHGRVLWEGKGKVFRGDQKGALERPTEFRGVCRPLRP